MEERHKIEMFGAVLMRLGLLQEPGLPTANLFFKFVWGLRAYGDYR